MNIENQNTVMNDSVSKVDKNNNEHRNDDSDFCDIISQIGEPEKFEEGKAFKKNIIQINQQDWENVTEKEYQEFDHHIYPKFP